MAKKAATKTAKAGAVKKTRKPRKKAGEPGMNAIWAELTDKIGSDSVQPYRMTGTFQVNVCIEHPTFGVGYVILSAPSKIDVAFQDANRSLVQNRE